MRVCLSFRRFAEELTRFMRLPFVVDLGYSSSSGHDVVVYTCENPPSWAFVVVLNCADDSTSPVVKVTLKKAL